MPRVIGPDFVALQVRDLEQSAAFYTQQLGLRRAQHSPPGAVVFETTPIPFAVRTPAAGVDLDAVPRLGWGVALWLACDDADALYQSLAATGAAVLQPPQPGPFGRQFQVQDPNGYVLTIHNGGDR